MPSDTPFVGEPADSRELIMRATYVALREHGYAGLSIQRIADETELSKSTFYHHFDDKEDLLLSFIEFILSEFVRFFSLEAGDDPRENLQTFVELLVLPESDLEQTSPSGKTAVLGSYVELRAQAVNNETVREQFTATDDTFVVQVADIVQSGIEEGVFRPVDPRQTAEFIVTIIGGSIFRQSTADDVDPEELLDEFEEYVDQCLLA